MSEAKKVRQLKALDQRRFELSVLKAGGHFDGCQVEPKDRKRKIAIAEQDIANLEAKQGRRG